MSYLGLLKASKKKKKKKKNKHKKHKPIVNPVIHRSCGAWLLGLEWIPKACNAR